MLQNCLNALTMQFGMTMPCAANPARQSAQKVTFPTDVFAIANTRMHICYTNPYRHICICYTNTYMHVHTYLPYRHV